MYSQQLAGQAQVPQARTQENSPPTFKHTQINEVVCGPVTRAQHGLNIRGQERPASVLEVLDEQRGPITFWLSNYQLESAFVDGDVFGRPVQQGDVIYVRFEGEAPIDGGKTVKNFACAGQAGGAAQVPQQGYPQPQAPPFQPQQAQPFPPQQPAPQPQQWQGPPQQPAQQWQPPQAPTGPVQQGEAPQPQWNTPPGQPF